MKFKTIAAILSVCLAVFSFAACDIGIKAKEYVPTSENYFDFVEIGGSYAISAKSGVALPSEIHLPTDYHGEKVTVVAEDAFSGSAITKIIVPSSYKEIKERAFKDCAALRNVTLNSVEKIGNQAFADCAGLSVINFPAELNEIGEFAFYQTEVTNLKFIGVKSIGKFAFYGCKNLKYVYIPSTTTSIGESAFGGIDAAINFDVSSSNEYYTVSGGTIAEK